VCAWDLWSLRSTTTSVVYAYDASVHDQMVRFATLSVQAGRSPFTSWFPFINLGSAQYLHYQSLGSVLTGLAGTMVGPGTAFRWALYLLLSLWPLAIYASARLFGLSGPVAAGAAVLSALLMSTGGAGFEQDAYLRVGGEELWTQLWGSWALPFAWALTWRATKDRRFVLPAAAAVALTIALHFECGYLALLGVVVIALAAGGPWRRRLASAGTVLGAAMAAAAWAWVPLVATSRWSAINEVLAPYPYVRGYGARQELAWLFSGDLFDAGRFPTVSLAVAAGVVVVLARWKRDALGRAFLALGAASLLLSFGPTTWGALADAVPGHADLFFRRFSMGAQLAGLYLAGTGVVAAGTVGARALRNVMAGRSKPARFAPGQLAVCCGVVVSAVALWPAVGQVSAYDARAATAVAAQEAADSVQGKALGPLVTYIKAHGGGRTYAQGVTVGTVQVYKYLESQDIDIVQYTLPSSSLMLVPENEFDQYNPVDYALFGVRYMIVPGGALSLVPAQLVMTSGDYALWELPSDGYVDLVEVTGRLSADRVNVGKVSSSVLIGTLLSMHQDLEVNWAGQQATGSLASPVTSWQAPGAVDAVKADLAVGELSTEVTMARAGTVLASVSYDPGWHATVDGRAAPVEMLAPAVMGVDVGPGKHRVVFTYVGFGSYPELLLVGVAGLGAAWWLGRRGRRTGAA
jgi:hypothetical protein